MDRFDFYVLGIATIWLFEIISKRFKRRKRPGAYECPACQSWDIFAQDWGDCVALRCRPCGNMWASER